VLKYLLAQNADLDLTVRGLTWGKGYNWETFVPSVNPISYAMMGLLRQFQRTEQQIYEGVSCAAKAQYGIDYSQRIFPINLAEFSASVFHGHRRLCHSRLLRLEVMAAEITSKLFNYF
jgi:hypothetical protein